MAMAEAWVLGKRRRLDRPWSSRAARISGMAHTTGVTARRKKAGQPSPLWRKPSAGTDEDLGAGLEGGEGPQAPGDGGERGAQAVTEDRPQKDRVPAGTVGCQHHEEGNELPRADRDAGGPDRRRSDVERLL